MPDAGPTPRSQASRTTAEIADAGKLQFGCGVNGNVSITRVTSRRLFGPPGGSEVNRNESCRTGRQDQVLRTNVPVDDLHVTMNLREAVCQSANQPERLQRTGVRRASGSDAVEVLPQIDAPDPGQHQHDVVSLEPAVENRGQAVIASGESLQNSDVLSRGLRAGQQINGSQFSLRPCLRVERPETLPVGSTGFFQDQIRATADVSAFDNGPVAAIDSKVFGAGIPSFPWSSRHGESSLQRPAADHGQTAGVISSGTTYGDLTLAF